MVPQTYSNFAILKTLVSSSLLIPIYGHLDLEGKNHLNSLASTKSPKPVSVYDPPRIPWPSTNNEDMRDCLTLAKDRENKNGGGADKKNVCSATMS